ncbi:uncharacterized protein ALTATR162_LOCUS7987 [Alternaria atra]|uniref:Uncharacterized protein n=1 Tax=Alternaria atra TaxID=119953 RepID=A0A8J2N425_9PLEO|nr:uncharacterized protein ALTATR162_LOCUS7987 [Alternaria atra]CAG5175152.1 unnamed protein product [Alternaria atra]
MEHTYGHSRYLYPTAAAHVTIQYMAKEKYLIIWQCCTCGRPSIPEPNGSICPSCEHAQCSDCKRKKLQLTS